MAPIRTQRVKSNVVEEADILDLIRATPFDFRPYYALFSEHLRPLSEFKTIPEYVTTVSLPNGDIGLQLPDGQEATFDVIAVVIGSCLQAPPGYPKSKFPFFHRWIKVTAADDASFLDAIDASRVLFNFMSSGVGEVLPAPQFKAAGSACFCPSATMLTSLETVPDAIAIDIPPLYNHIPFEAAVVAGHGKHCFSSDNEVLYFGDNVNCNGDIIRREISPTAIRVGQVVQVKMVLRLLKQENETFTFREVLKGVHVLHNGLSDDIARTTANRSLGNGKQRGRNVKAYNLGPGNTQLAPAPRMQDLALAE